MKRCLPLALALVFLAGCGGAPADDRVATEVAAQRATAASAPTDSLVPTAIVEPTSTLPPTATLEPTATPKPLVSCPDNQVKAYLDELDLLLEEWKDVYARAETTGRIALSPVIGELQAIRRNARRLDRPECASYLQEVVVVAMDRDIDAFLAFLGQESDTVVSRKLSGAEQAWTVVNSDLDAFKMDPVAAYEAHATTAAELQAQLDQPIAFVRPEGWQDLKLGNGQVIVSVPPGWTRETYGEEDQESRLQSADRALTVLSHVFAEPYFGEMETDPGRLFALQTTLETWGYDFYLEHSAESGVYALNRGYVVRFSARQYSGDDIEEGLWAVIISPDGDEALFMVSTTRDDLAQVDLLTLNQIFGSMRRQ